MATTFDKIKWQLHSLKYDILFKYGISCGLIRLYDDETLENLRNVYYGGVPASIILLLNGLCQGKCYDRALLMTMGCGDDDFKLVDADIDGLTLQPRYVDEFRDTGIKHYGNHCFVERTMQNGKIWVYDTTWGLCYEKSLYYAIHKPKITKINDRKTTINYIEYQDIKNADINKDKYILPSLLPIIEENIDKAYPWYQEQLKQEIEDFKKKIDFDGIVKEIEEDMKISREMRKTMKK